MENIVFYFTGTGNSLVVARDIAAEIENTTLVSIAEAIKDKDINLSYSRIGFVFPVYYSSVPLIVKQFIERLRFNNSQYIFGVITYGGTMLGTFSELNHCVTAQGGTLSAGFPVRMPGNYIVKYGAFSKLIQGKLFKGEKKKVKNISMAIKGRKILFKPKGNFISRAFTGYGDKKMKSFGKNAQNFKVNGNCTGCASCEKICPVNNIKMENNHPKWGNECEQCMACIQWCPTKAIEYADKTAKRKHYHNPEVKISDLFSNSMR